MRRGCVGVVTNLNRDEVTEEFSARGCCTVGTPDVGLSRGTSIHLIQCDRLRRKYLQPQALWTALVATMAPRSVRACRTAGQQSRFAGKVQVRWSQVVENCEITCQRPPGISHEDVDHIPSRASGTCSSQPRGRATVHLSQPGAAPALVGDGVNKMQFLSTGSACPTLWQVVP
jgi:hypothetical protein